MHRPVHKPVQQNQTDKVKKTFEKSAGVAVFGNAKRPWPMMNRYFTDSKTVSGRQSRNITMHITKQMDGGSDFAAVQFVTAIHVVYFHSRKKSGNDIGRLGNEAFGPRIFSGLFPTTNQIPIRRFHQS